MVSYKLSPKILDECFKYQADFDLSYGQLVKWLYRTYQIKMTASGIRKAMLRLDRENE